MVIVEGLDADGEAIDAESAPLLDCRASYVLRIRLHGDLDSGAPASRRLAGRRLAALYW